MWRITSVSPITASWSYDSISSTPAAANLGPPIPVSLRSGLLFRSSAATPDACRSPDASPATKKTSAKRGGLHVRAREAALHGARELRQRPLDLLHDSERYLERAPPVLAGNYRRRLA